MTEKKRGAQPGNANAFRHGFYSPRLKPGQWQAGESYSPDSLEPEINALRVLLRRLNRAIESAPRDADTSDAEECLLTASTRLATLARLQTLLVPRKGISLAALMQAVREIEIKDAQEPLDYLLSPEHLAALRRGLSPALAEV